MKTAESRTLSQGAHFIWRNLTWGDEIITVKGWKIGSINKPSLQTLNASKPSSAIRKGISAEMLSLRMLSSRRNCKTQFEWEREEGKFMKGSSEVDKIGVDFLRQSPKWNYWTGWVINRSACHLLPFKKTDCAACASPKYVNFGGFAVHASNTHMHVCLIPGSCTSQL